MVLFIFKYFTEWNLGFALNIDFRLSMLYACIGHFLSSFCFLRKKTPSSRVMRLNISTAEQCIRLVKRVPDDIINAALLF